MELNEQNNSVTRPCPAFLTQNVLIELRLFLIKEGFQIIINIFIVHSLSYNII